MLNCSNSVIKHQIRICQDVKPSSTRSGVCSTIRWMDVVNFNGLCGDVIADTSGPDQVFP